MAPLNVGFIGYGFSTKCFHLPFISPNPDLNVYAFLQRAPAPSSKEGVGPGSHCTIDYPNAKHYRTSDEFFGDPSIDIVCVCTQHDTHAEFAEKALSAGKHVVVEKPFTPTEAEAERLISFAKGKGKILTVFQNRRYDSDFLTLHHLISKNALGPITEAEIHYDVDFPFWLSGFGNDYSPGDGMMFGLGSHTIDQALLLFGLPASVTGFYRSLRGVESKVDDSFTIILQYAGETAERGGKGNLIVTIKTSVVATMVQPLKHFIRGYDGTWIKFGTDMQESQFSAGMKATDEKFGVEDPSTYGELTTKKQFDKCQTEENGTFVGKYPSYKGDYCAYYVDLVAAIRGQSEVKVKPEESKYGLRVIELARESAEKGVTMQF